MAPSPGRRAPRIFVVGAYQSNGGTHMAYHVARIVQEEFRYLAVAVGDEEPTGGIFEYDVVFPTISMAELEQTMTAADILFANAGHSRFLLGPRLPGRKIMYVQGFTTALPLDCRYDSYVSVSSFVSNYLQALYGIDAPLIPPFIDAALFAAAGPWEARPPASVVVHAKGRGAELAVLKELIAKRGLPVELESAAAASLPHRQFAARIGAARHLISVSAAEGFGLVPLEAMALGTAVIGFDGYGGRDYMQDGVNCACTSRTDFDGLVDRIGQLLDDPARAARYVAAGRRTAQRYDYAAFRAAWKGHVGAFLARASA